MFKSKNILSLLSLLVLLSMLNLVAGCGNILESKNAKDKNNKPNLTNSSSEPISLSCDEIFQLDNGISVYMYEFMNSDQLNEIHYSYIYNNTEFFRILRFNAGLTEAEVFDSNNNFIYGYKFGILADQSTVTFSNWTTQDSLYITFGNKGLNNSYNLNGEITNCNFANYSEYEYAFDLFDNYDSLTILNMPEYEQTLYQRVLSYYNLTHTDNSFSENIDGEIVSYFVNNNDFTEWLTLKIGYTTTDILACDIASLLTISCWCFATGWCALLCVPATGISLACAAAGVAKAME